MYHSYIFLDDCGMISFDSKTAEHMVALLKSLPLFMFDDSVFRGYIPNDDLELGEYTTDLKSYLKLLEDLI